MKKLFVILFRFVSVSVFAQEGKYTIFTDDVTDIRYKLWYWGINSMGDGVNEFFSNFDRKFVQRTIAKDDFASLNEPYLSICKNLLDRGRNISIPNLTTRVMIICDDKYGVLLYWWNDTSSFGGEGPQERIMLRHFFELKPVR